MQSSLPAASHEHTPVIDTGLPVPFDNGWFAAVSQGMGQSDVKKFQEALTVCIPLFKDQYLATGEPLASHVAGTVKILSTLQVDLATRLATLCFALPDHYIEYPPTKKTNLTANPKPSTPFSLLSDIFKEEIWTLVSGYKNLIRVGELTRLNTPIHNLSSNSQLDKSSSNSAHTSQSEMLRKMLLAMASDVRIVLMRLASRLQTLRWHAETKQAPDAAMVYETLDLYAPLANRLGIWQIKWEMEDLAFRFDDPQRYKQIAHLLEEKRVEREAFIQAAIQRLRSELAREGIEAEVSGRPKHIFSIWNKMRSKGIDFSALYDLRAFRVIVADIKTCYAVLGLIHNLWTPLPREFDDYISRPKPNGYRSLHTVVFGEDERPFEVQIRTHDMHQFAEYGIAAHWRYKENSSSSETPVIDNEYQRRLSWIRQLIAWRAEVRLDTLDDQIYVLTPQARIVELPARSTPVDFAYHLHTDLGHRCRGARVNGHMVPLSTPLQTGQTVEIVTVKTGGPSRDWLNLQLGYLASTRARNKVRQWFNAIENQERIQTGQALVEKELARLGKTATNLDQLANRLGFEKTNEFFIAVAKEEFSLRQIEAILNPTPVRDTEAPVGLLARARHADNAAKTGKSGVLVVGVDALLTQLARCCRPAPPDLIAGYITRGRGVSIHRTDCKSFATLMLRQSERCIDVTWGETVGSVYPVDIRVIANDRAGLLRDITEVFAREKINVIGVNTQSSQGQARMLFTAEVKDAGQLQKALTMIKEVNGIAVVSRR